jgi:carboxypeptidase family protein
LFRLDANSKRDSFTAVRRLMGGPESFLVVHIEARSTLYAQTTVPKPVDPLKRLRVAAPCSVTWESMHGDDRIRHCTLCDLNVYNFAEMTRDEVRELLARSEGRICGRLYRRTDGTLMTSDCPSRFRAVGRRMTRLAASVMATVLSLSAFALEGATWHKPRLRRHGSKVKLEIEHVTQQQAIFTGVVADESGNPLPGVTVLVRDEALRREITAVTDANGMFTIASLNDGLYRVEVTLNPFRSAVLEHLPLKQDDVTHARVTLQLEVPEEIVVGAIAVDPLANGISTTFSQDLINKLPIQ